jgi:hypothetical protein
MKLGATIRSLCFMLSLAVAGGSAFGNDAMEVRSPAQTEYTSNLWEFVQKAQYQDWSQFRGPFPIAIGPGTAGDVRVYLNSRARTNLKNFAPGSALVCEHLRDGEIAGITVYALPSSNSSNTSGDSEQWYWAHYLPNGDVVKTSADRNPFEKKAFYTVVKDGRLWVFALASEALAEYFETGGYEKHVTMPGGGPGGMTVKAPTTDEIYNYMTLRDGFVTKIIDGRLWVFLAGTPEAADLANGEVSEKHVTRVGDGPLGLTIKSADSETIDAYLTQKSGFETAMVDGRLWVFRVGSEEWNEFKTNGPNDKHVTQVGVGPQGMTVKAPDYETITDYMTSAKGFRTFLDDGRLWVFLDRSGALSEYLATGEPAKCVTRVGEGPLGMTVKSDDASTIEMYLAAVAE